MKIEDYIILERLSVEKLEEAVLRKIGDGWQPFGSLATTAIPAERVSKPEVTYVQPMVRYEE